MVFVLRKEEADEGRNKAGEGMGLRGLQGKTHGNP